MSSLASRRLRGALLAAFAALALAGGLSTVQTQSHASALTSLRSSLTSALTAAHMTTAITATAHAAPAFTWHLGYSVQGGWLCYGTSAWLHCTSHWSVVNGRYVSGNPSWVPSQGNAVPSAPSGNSVPWRGGSTDSYPRGQCTDGAARLAYDNVDHLGNAWQWIGNAMRRGMPTGGLAKLNATVVFQPRVQYAGALGHVAHVIALGAGGSFEIREMNAYGWGGGFDRFSTRWVHQGGGVSFVY